MTKSHVPMSYMQVAFTKHGDMGSNGRVYYSKLHIIRRDT